MHLITTSVSRKHFDFVDRIGHTWAGNRSSAVRDRIDFLECFICAVTVFHSVAPMARSPLYSFSGLSVCPEESTPRASWVAKGELPRATSTDGSPATPRPDVYISLAGPAPGPRGVLDTPPTWSSCSRIGRAPEPTRRDSRSSQSRLRHGAAPNKDGAASLHAGRLLRGAEPTAGSLGSGDGAARSMEECGSAGSVGSDSSTSGSGGAQQRELERMAEVLVTGEQLR